MDTNKVPEWKVIQEQLRKSDFKNSVLNFNKDNISTKCKNFIQKQYIQTEKFDVKAIYKASGAAGPLADWMKSIVEYADIFERIAPLRAEVEELETEAQRMEAEMAELEAEIKQLQINYDSMQADF